jgi:16S rRNA (uracil1498-N3)-methyltransferase
MRRFFLASPLLTEDQIDLPADILKHLQVLRLSPGARIELLDGQGLSCRCELLALDKKGGRVQILERFRVSETALPITLYQGLPKAEKLELVLQKGTELGITRFCPTICQRSQHTDRKAAGPRQARWDKIVREASRQSGKGLLPQVDAPALLSRQLEACRADLRLVPWEEASTPLVAALPQNPPRDVAVLIGPEGGLSGEEVELAVRYDFLPVSLGPRILRTETAGFAVAGILQYLYGDLGR